MAPLTPHRSDGKSILIDSTESFVSPSQHSSRILVRTYNDDGSTKSIFTDDSMSIRDVLFILIHKNHREPHIDYVLMEILPDLHMGNRLSFTDLMTNFIIIISLSLNGFQNGSSKIIRNYPKRY